MAKKKSGVMSFTTATLKESEARLPLHRALDHSCMLASATRPKGKKMRRELRDMNEGQGEAERWRWRLKGNMLKVKTERKPDIAYQLSNLPY